MYSLVLILMMDVTAHEFVIDENLTREDCGNRIIAGEQFVPFGGEGRILFSPDDVTYVCEAQGA